MSNGLGPAGRAAATPYVVIDGTGSEVGVVVSYDQYVRLLRVVAAEVDRKALPAYWRRALEGCLMLDDGAISRTPERGATYPPRRPGRARRSGPGA
jgi:hypothetical protein